MAPDISAAAASAPGYRRAHSLAEALAAVAAPGTTVLGGGTDLYPAHVGRAFPQRVVDVSAVAEMRSLVREGAALRIGGAATWSEIARAELPPPLLALQQAARQIGSIQVQNRGAIAGNLCNASPAADGVPPLLILDAEVELASLAATRRLKLADFLLGYRQTALRSDEILTAVIAPEIASPARSAFVKLGARKYLVISIVMAAALVRNDAAGAIVEARVAVGAASATARRLASLEHDLVGLPADRAPSSRLRASHVAELTPIDDARASAAYRIDAALSLVGEALDRAAEGGPP